MMKENHLHNETWFQTRFYIGFQDSRFKILVLYYRNVFLYEINVRR